MPTLPGILEINARRTPERTALVFGERTLSFRELNEEANRVARVLSGMGVKKGDRVALMSPNTDAFVISFYGILKAGGIFVSINPRLAVPELVHQLTDSGTKVFLYDPVVAPVVDEALKEELPVLERALPTRPMEGREDLTTLARKEEGLPLQVTIEESDDAEILYTSGTTGKAKGVLLDHHRVVWVSTIISLGVGLREGDTFIHVAPLYHSAQLNLFLTSGIMLACKNVVLPTFDPGQVLETIEKEKVTVFFGVPTMFQFLLEHPDFKKRDLSSLRIAMYGAAPMPTALITKLLEELPGVDFYNLCGLTEMGPMGIYLKPEDQVRKVGSAGKPIILNEARVVNDRMEDVKPGEVGELILRAETMMKGYWNNPGATAETIRDGWLFTGDLATVDEEGYITLVDRKKDMIITGGMNVYSAEVENAVRSHPNVLDCAVIGVPHPVYGETVTAVVTPKPGTEITLEELREHCAKLIADYKVPRKLIIDQVPRNPSGKILKYQLREKYAREGA
ncbi:MAG: long-chain-fatty-acid--CoA ligase [Deltaproteobacteria bacterium]|nr:MAG: long-chain-fatty-acid--CoA ligase [Deltaproteobacteria bacterium]